MALTDVSEALTDPDFCDSIRYVRNIQTVDANGVASVAAQTFTIFAVVTNASGDKLMRGTSEGEHIEGNILVHSVTRLIAGSGDITADIILWAGRQFTVSKVSDWSNFGRGFTAAECDLMPFKG